jgi:hypothetical protein
MFQLTAHVPSSYSTTAAVVSRVRKCPHEPYIEGLRSTFFSCNQLYLIQSAITDDTLRSARMTCQVRPAMQRYGGSPVA